MRDVMIERSPSSVAVTRLYVAANEGNVSCLVELVEEDPLILNNLNITGRFVQSPLHIAAKLGHSEFTKEILRRKPELAEELDLLKRWTPLHFAAAKGHLEIVKDLMEVNPNTCFARDQDGRSPVHIAAINGRIDVLDELLKDNPSAAMERTNDGDTVLHLCVKHKQSKALMKLANVIDDGDELLNSTDAHGNTILHLAVAAKLPELVKFLLEKERRMKGNTMNQNGSTAMDVCNKSRGDDKRTKEIREALKLGKELPAKEVLETKCERSKLEENRSGLMVVASLIATMAFQIGVNPPGGVFQEDVDEKTASACASASNNRNTSTSCIKAVLGAHYAGVSIMADQATRLYISLMMMNSVAVVSSLSVILLLIGGLPLNNSRHFVRVLRTEMWIAVTAITLTYATSFVYLAANHRHAFRIQVAIDVVWALIVLALLYTHAHRFLFVKHIKSWYHNATTCASRRRLPATDANRPSA